MEVADTDETTAAGTLLRISVYKADLTVVFRVENLDCVSACKNAIIGATANNQPLDVTYFYFISVTWLHNGSA
jgi:hypothetical protein